MPFPKNPAISKVFREIGLADELGSGMRNTYKYTKLYSGVDPLFEERDIFRTIIPLKKIATQKVGGSSVAQDVAQDKIALAEFVKEKIKKISKIGEIMTAANTELGKLNITIEKTELFVKTAIENGAAGAKISGGGLGGCVIALAKNLEIVEKIKNGLIKCGAENIWVEKI